MIIRVEEASDVDKIWKINSEAFETNIEANLVNALRNSGCEFISLVAVTDGKIVGHILFTPVELTNDKNNLKIAGLAPMAVSTLYQKKGIGSKLVYAGLEHCKSKGYAAVVVLGHPTYYPKFGFVPSVKYDIKSEYDVPDNVFMILELIPKVLNGHNGIIKYHDEFNNV